MNKITALILAAVMASCAPAAYANACNPVRDKAGHIKRSAYQVLLFKHAHPCPANGAVKGRCPGYIVDHIVPLCACGADKPANMQWQTLAESRAKDRLENQQCHGKGD